MANEAIRNAIRDAGLKQWEVADAYGLCEGNFCRLLRHELTDERRQRVEAAIEKAKAGKEDV